MTQQKRELMSRPRMIFRLTVAAGLVALAATLVSTTENLVFSEDGGISYAAALALISLYLAGALAFGVARGRGWVKGGGSGGSSWASGGGGSGGGGMSCGSGGSCGGGGGCGGGSGG